MWLADPSAIGDTNTDAQRSFLLSPKPREVIAVASILLRVLVSTACTDLRAARVVRRRANVVRRPRVCCPDEVEDATAHHIVTFENVFNTQISSKKQPLSTSLNSHQWKRRTYRDREWKERVEPVDGTCSPSQDAIYVTASRRI